mmetsp:Transcript_28386/g.77930  ORF Transcript_28386/g.77930 Transcript_28386/m.77930 type:complete len:729 (-) Transcript_28386:604-2790(-)
MNLGLKNDSEDSIESALITTLPRESYRPAKKVTLRRWGQRPRRIPLIDTTLDDEKEEEEEAKEEQLVWPRKEALLQLNTLISVEGSSRASNVDEIFYYQVVEVDGENNISQRRINNIPVFFSTATTEYRLETLHRPFTCPKLPPRPAAALTHPNLDELTRALLLPPHASPSQRVVLAVAKQEDHDTRGAVQAAAAVTGRSCLVVSGLAAHSYRSHQKLLRAASFIDKLKGLKSSLDQAYHAAPSVLLLENVDLEFTSWNLDSRLRQDEESRFWSCLVSELGGNTDAAERTSTYLEEEGGCVGVPSVIVILAMTAIPKRGAVAENMVWQPIALSFPDTEHTKHLWNQANGPSLGNESFGLLNGRPAAEISGLAQDVSDDLAPLESSFESEKQKFAESLLRGRLAESSQDRQQSSSQASIPKVCWSDVGGLDHVRKEIMDTIDLPLKHSHLFPSSRGRSGILLYGPPGTGKTLVAKAVANECGLPFLSVKGPELLGSYVGESEANVRAVFAQARSLASRNLPNAASIVFFDELDSLAPRRSEQQGSSGGAGVMDRVVATFFAELDVTKDGLSVFCIGATNRPDILDPNLLRPGRLDRAVYLGLTDFDRVKILEVHLAKLRLVNGTTPKEMSEIALGRHLDKQFSGADLAMIASSALMRATTRLCDEAERQQQESDHNLTLDQVLSSWEPESLEPIIELNDVLESAKSVVPSVDEAQLANYEKLRQGMERS